MGAAKQESNKVNIEKIIKRTAKEVVGELEKKRLLKKDDITPYQKTEKLLYSYLGLIKAIEQKEKDIQFIEEHGLQERSKDIVIYTSGGGSGSHEEKHLEIVEGYKKAKEKSQWLKGKIDKALDSIRQDQYFYIIEERYFSGNSPDNDAIAEKYNVSTRTIQRHRGRLVNDLQLLLFGADALDYLF